MRSRRVERRRRSNREALMRAARQLFARKGFEATTIADIAEAADLGFGTFYLYFKDKQAVLDALFQEGRSEFEAALRAPELDAMTPAEALSELMARFVRLVRRHRDVLSLMWQVSIRRVRGRARSPRLSTTDESSLPVIHAAAVRRIVERGMASADFAPGDPELLSWLITSAHMYAFSPTLTGADDERLIATLRIFQLRALGAAESEEPWRT